MLGKTPFRLSEEFKYALALLESGDKHVFITGRAGTGKSTLLQIFAKTSDKRIAVLAPTGIAALNVGGQTIHSFFGFPPRILDPSEIKKKKNYRLFQNLDLIIIDEISMVRADMLDQIDQFLRVNRKSNAVFGGINMVFFGDLYQLPPVISSPIEKEYLRARYKNPYFFSAHVMHDLRDFELIDLKRVYRQSEKRFIKLLDNIRSHFFDYDDLEDINARYNPQFKEEGYITLSARNATVDRINHESLMELKTEMYEYNASVIGDFTSKLFPCPLTLKLKVGAQVMFVKNDPERRFVNGTIGIIKSLGANVIQVQIEVGHAEAKVINIERMEWEIIKYQLDPVDKNKINTKVVGTFEQFPINLAWAITIHKSQGKTFDKIIIDLGSSGAFAHGQTYVALSRCRTLDGIVLKQKLRPQDIIVDPAINSFLSSYQ